MWIKSKRKARERRFGSGYTGPLDLVPGAVVAYSNRAMSAALIGTALYTIKRSSDSTTQSFNSASNGNAPISSINSFIGGGNSGYVTIWNDQSGNGIDLLDHDDGLLPNLWDASFHGSKPGLTASNPDDGTNRMFSSATTSLAGGAATVFLVGQGRCNCKLQDADPTNQLNMQAGASAVIDMFSANNHEAGGSYNGIISDDTFVVLDAAVQFGTNDYKVNGVSLPANNDFDAVGTVGTLVDLFTNLNGLSAGGRQEILVYASYMSDANRLLIRQNMADYYGITLA